MNSSAKDNGTVQLVRAGKELRNPKYERVVTIAPPNAPVFMPPILSRKSFVVPDGNLASPIDLDGTPLRARIEETREEVQLYPELRILAVEEGGGEALAGALYHTLDFQLPELRNRIDGIFRKVVGVMPSVTDLEAISIFKGGTKVDLMATEIAKRIRVELGLSVHWILSPEPVIANWMQPLMAATPLSGTLAYNEEIPTKEFKLEFSMKVENADLQKLHLVRRRATSGLEPADEIKRLFQRIHQITNPAFRSALMGVNVWNEGIVREMSMDGFETVVKKRLLNEFGYVISFSNFSPKLNQDLTDRINRTLSYDSSTTDLTGMQSLVETLQSRLHDAIRTNDGNMEATDVVELEKNLSAVKARLESAEKQHMQGRNSPALLSNVTEEAKGDLRKKFRDALQLEDDVEKKTKYGGGGRD